jgi:hypothetical protein
VCGEGKELGEEELRGTEEEGEGSRYKRRQKLYA